MGAPVLLKNASDSYVSERYPTKNFNSVNKLYLADNSAADTRYAYIYFGVPSGMKGTTIISAKLRLYSGAGFAGSVTMSVRRLAAKFTVSRVNWNNKPAVHGTVAALTKVGAAAGTMWEYNVTAEMQAVANGNNWYGFRIDATNSSAKWLYSAQAIDKYRPQLEITWSDAPDAPEVLRPDDDIVSVAKPTLQWDFTDPSGDTTMAAFDLKLFSTLALANANGAGDLLNLAGQASSVPQWDLDDTAYAGLAADATVWWRVRVQDGAGLWSAWSRVASFTRKTKGTLTITNPATSPNNFVTDATPPFSWTFTGQTQRAFEAILTTPETPAIYLWRSGIVTSTDDDVTPPEGKITENGKTYRLILRVYDTLDRATLPDDPNYVEATRDFTYNLSPLTNVTNLVKTIDLYRPQITLTFERATAPDYFVIYRDGIVIATVEPSELFVAGTTYQYIDKLAKPRTQHTWAVAVNVNGVTSSGNPSVTGLVKAVSTMLSELDGSRELFLFNPNVSAAKQESSDVHYVLGDAPPILITQSRRGYEGSAGGRLATDVIPGVTALTQQQALDYFRANPGVKLRLVWMDKVMTVVVRNVTDSPVAMNDGTTEYDAKFDFFQVDY